MAYKPTTSTPDATISTGYEAHRRRVNALRDDIQRVLDHRLALGDDPTEALRAVGQQLRAARRAQVLRDVCLLERAAA